MTSQYSVPCRSVQTNPTSASHTSTTNQNTGTRQNPIQAIWEQISTSTLPTGSYAVLTQRRLYTKTPAFASYIKVSYKKFQKEHGKKSFSLEEAQNLELELRLNKQCWFVVPPPMRGLSPSSLAVGSVRLFAKMHLYFLPEDHHSQVGVGGLVHGFGLDAHSVLLRGQLVRAMFLMPEVEKTRNWSPNHDEITM